MSYQAVFKRYELKYLLTWEQKMRLLQGMEEHMALDRYGRTTIRNLYFDTDAYRLIRHSLEKPAYKEKLRLRSYTQTESPVYVELKKKYRGVVYKRRLSMSEQAAMEWLCGSEDRGQDSQIGREIDYFRHYYEPLRPTVFLSYEREAYYCRKGGDFRVTFDDNILARQEALSLTAPVWGTTLLEPGNILMELKTSGGIPLWMTELLTRERLYKTTFSKYGNAYLSLIDYKGVYHYA